MILKKINLNHSKEGELQVINCVIHCCINPTRIGLNICDKSYGIIPDVYVYGEKIGLETNSNIIDGHFLKESNLLNTLKSEKENNPDVLVVTSDF